MYLEVLMADDRSIRVRLIADIQSYVQGLKTAAVATGQFGREVSGMGKASSADIEKVGRGALIMASGLAVGLGLSAKAAIDWESAWAGVTKTVDGSASEMAELEEGLRDLAKELPASHAEIAAVAEAAGALGIQRSAIEGFTKTMIDLGETTDLTADQAATAMAQIANVMQTPQTEFDRMGATLVELGNNGASTESEILELANRLAAAGKIAGLSEADVFSFASTLASVGVNAEAGGTALSKTFTRVRDAVIDGGDHLEIFAEVAGTTAEEFAAAFRADPSDAIAQFIAGLGRMNDAGESTSSVFKDLELNDERLKRALLSTAGAGELLTEQLLLGRDAWDANTALQTEAEKRYATTAAQLGMLRNQVVDLGIDLGSVLLPALRSTADFLGTLVKGFASMPDPLKTFTLGVGGAALAGLGMVAAAALLIPKIRALRAALLTMGAAGRTAAAAMPWLAAAAAAVAAVSYVFGQNAKKAEEAEARVKGYTDAITSAGDATAGTTDHLRELLAESPEVAAVLDDAGVSAEDLGTALAGTDAEWSAMKESLLAAAEAAGITGTALLFLEGGLDDQRDAALEGAANAETLGRVLGDTGDEAAGATPAVEGMAAAVGLTAEEAEEAEKALKSYLDAIRAGVDPLFGMLDAINGNRDAQDAYTAALAANRDEIEDNNVSQAELDRLLQDVAESALDVESAAAELEAAVIRGTVSTEDYIDQLKLWVDAGLLTEAQALMMAEKFGIAADEADRVDGDRTATFYGNTEPIRRAIASLISEFHNSRIDIQVQANLGAGRILRAKGGMVDDTGPFSDRPVGSDSVAAFLTPGEGVLNTRAMSIIGPSGLDALNAGRSPGAMFTGGGGVAAPSGLGGGTVVNNYYTENIYASSIDASSIGRTVKDSLIAAGRRGITRETAA